MAKQKRNGVCCICGTVGELSFEHVPPQAAYNKSTYIEYSFEEYLQHRKAKGRTRQGGVGAYTLCPKCNNDTGSWYGNEFVKWARTCRDVMVYWRGKQIDFGTVSLMNVYPIRFLKQVVTCFFSDISAPNTNVFAQKNSQLVKFVLDKHEKTLPPEYRFFMNLYDYSPTGETHLRHSPMVGRLPVTYNDEGIISVADYETYSELAHPPFQLIMSYEGKPFSGGTEITSFADYDYDQQVSVSITLRVRDSSNPFASSN